MSEKATQGSSPAEFSISPVREGVVNVEIFNVGYRAEIGDGYRKIEVSRDGELLEISEMGREGDTFNISMKNDSGESMTWTSRIVGDQASTRIEIDGQSCEVQSGRQEHGRELARALHGKNKMSMPYLRRFSEQYKRNHEFRNSLTAAGFIPNGGTGIVCGIACSCCLIAGGEIACCPVCAQCLLEA